MEKKRFFTTKTIAGLGILTAMVIVLQLIANYIQFGPVSITLALFPIAVGAMMFGPLGGLFLGLVDGALILSAPSTMTGFFVINPAGTIITCLTKTAIAGLVAGLVFKLLREKHVNLGIVLASLLVPLLNTGIFVIYTFIFFKSALDSGAADMGVNSIYMLFIIWIGWNFLLEFGLNAALAPGFFKTYTYFESRNRQKEE